MDDTNTLKIFNSSFYDMSSISEDIRNSSTSLYFGENVLVDDWGVDVANINDLFPNATSVNFGLNTNIPIGYNLCSMQNIISYSVDDGNTLYSSYNGCIYSKDFGELLIVPNALNELVIKDVTMKISGLLSNTTLNEIDCPEGIVEIDVIGELTNLSSLCLPSTLKTVGDYFLLDAIFAPNINITYNGTIEQISKVITTRGQLGGYTIHCTDGDYTIE